MKTMNIFAHKGHVGANINMEDGKFINDPGSPGQMGCVVSTSEVSISKEAADLIRKAKREGGSFAPLMLTVHTGQGTEHGRSSIGVLGGGNVYLGDADTLTIGRTCDLEALDHCEIVENSAPEDFQKFIEEEFK